MMDPIRLARVTNGCVVKKILVHHRYQILRGVGISRKKNLESQHAWKDKTIFVKSLFQCIADFEEFEEKEGC